MIPNSIYAQKAYSKLLSPQHVARERKDNRPNRNGTWCATYEDRIVFWWDQEKYKRTVSLDEGSSHVGTINTAPGYSRFNAFCATCQEEPDPDIVAYVSAIIEDDEEEGVSAIIEEVSDSDTDDEEQILQRDEPLTTDFRLDGPTTTGKSAPNIIEDEEDKMPQDVSAEFLRWHHKLGHISPRRMQLMARSGMIPKRLATCPVPLCTSCLFGKATRRPWRAKTPANQDQASHTLTAPGDCVSIDQLVSTTPGLIAQLRGQPTKARYKVATIFVDQYSGLSYVHLQRSTSAEETVEAKLRFEQFARGHGVNHIKHYHADNGIFADNLFRKAVAEGKQTLSFCGVNAHWQNGVAERRIRELQDHARTMLIHANKQWPQAITANLWPYALRMANDVLNSSPRLKSKQDFGTRTPVEIFSGSQVSCNPKHWHPFGCPVYALDSAISAGKSSGKKWTDRA